MSGLEPLAVAVAAPLVIQGVNYTYDSAKKKFLSLKKLGQKLDFLKETVERLRAILNDWEAEVQRNKRKTITHSYSYWKSRTMTVIQKADSLICKYGTKRPSKFYFNERSALTDDITERYDKVLELLQQNDFPRGILADKPAERVIKMNAPNVSKFRALQEPLKQILDSLQNDKIKMIGIRGMVGVGKTTVMQNLNNHEEIAKQFDIVIWLEVGSEGNEENLRRQLAERLNLSVEGITATVISEELKEKKYLLLLDEVVKPLRLHTIGISDSNNKKKVVFTDNSSVKLTMDKMIPVCPLSREETWNMFFQEIDNDVSNAIDSSEIISIARQIADKCAGLPLLITKLATSLKPKNVSGWRNALAELTSWPQIEFQGLEEVYEFLKFCYNDLRRNDRKCFLYAALYPAYSKIYADYLVECWACQGFLGNIDDSIKYQNVRDKGKSILGHLTDVSLLGKDDEKMIYVWMNSFIRQFALYILSRDPKAKFLVKNSENVLEPTETKYWHEAKRISMIGSKLSNLPEGEDCSILLTLLLQVNSTLTRIAQSFFVTMRNLLVLDLYSTGVLELPSSISNLTSLRGLYLNDCRQLTMLPQQVGELPLEVLDIRSSGITPIPSHIQQLINLRCLRMSYNKVSDENGSKREKNCDVISNLTRLEELMIDVMSYDEWCNEAADVISQVASLENLTTLRICFPVTGILKTFLANRQSRSAQQLTSFRFFIGCQTSKRPEILEFFEYKINRYLKYCNGECEDDFIICTLVFELIGHTNIKTLSDFSGIASMKEIRGFLISECNKIVTILDGNRINADILPKLEQLYLSNLPNLRIIFDGILSHGSLSKLQILELKSCPMLTKIFSDGIFQQLVEVKKLTVEDCPEIEELIMKSESSASNSSYVLPKLETLTLVNMPKLNAIYADKSLAWQSLEVLNIYGCPELKRLPFSRGNATNLRAIEGEQQWWDGLQESIEIKENLRQICRLQ